MHAQPVRVNLAEQTTTEIPVNVYYGAMLLDHRPARLPVERQLVAHLQAEHTSVSGGRWA